MKKRLFLILTLFMIFSGLMYAEDDFRTVTFSTTIPDDYGVVFPSDALRLDRFFFEMPDGDLVAIEGISSPIIASDTSSLLLDILYYGNLPKDYNVVLEANTTGWVYSVDGTTTIPVSISIPDYIGEKGISAEEDQNGNSLISVPAVGARRGDKVGTLVIRWEYPQELLPGYYSMDIDLNLRSVE